MKYFHSRFSHLGKLQLVNELDDVLQGRLHHLGTAAYDAEAQNGALPQILVSAFRYGSVELVGDPSLNSFEYPSFAFEGMIFGQDEIEL